MMEWFNPKVWLAIGLAVILALSHGFAYRAGKAAVRADWDQSIATQLRASAAAEQENRRMESLRSAKVIEAQNAQAKRTQTLQASAAGARAESSGLRDDIAAIRTGLPSHTDNAASNAVSTAAGLLAECAAAYQGMAAAADGHRSDAMTLQQAWPK